MYLFCFEQYRTSAEEKRHLAFQYLFGCLGKYLEHQRIDRDQYVQILHENIKPGYTQNTADFSTT